MKMIEFFCTLTLSGEDFSPQKFVLPSNLKIEKNFEKGDIGLVGIYKNKPHPYGIIRLSGTLDDILIFATSSNFIQIEGIDVNIHMDVFYSDQCNFEFSHEQLQKLASLNIPFGISCDTKN